MARMALKNKFWANCHKVLPYPLETRKAYTPPFSMEEKPVKYLSCDYPTLKVRAQSWT